MKKIIIAVLITAITTMAFYNQAIRMNRVGSRSINYQWSECYYQSYTNPGFGTISITIKGGTFNCPYSIKYYPESGTWSKGY